MSSPGHDIANRLALAGYVARRRDVLAVAALLGHRGGGAPTALLEGPPGAGKTALGEAIARGWGWPLVFAQLHAWTDADELFVGVDVASAVAGDAERVRQDGVLARAARLSHEHERVVLVLDEVDKTHERAECLLLDFLQSGRVPVRPGEHLQARLDRLIVILTSNAQRALSDALLRRCRRVRIDPLPVELLDRLVAERSGAPTGVVTVASKACRILSEIEGTALSLQEIAHATRECWELADSADDVREILSSWAARSDVGVAALTAGGARHDRRAAQLIPTLWGAITTARRDSRVAARINA